MAQSIALIRATEPIRSWSRERVTPICERLSITAPAGKGILDAAPLRLARRIPQAPEEPAQTRPADGLAPPARLPFFKLHHVLEPPVEEVAGLAPSLALVVDPDEKGRGVDAREDQALGVMI